jgi:predicted TIM-barrel fold metal-dependent hydrolase
MLEFSDPHVLLEWARDVGETVPFLDFHVHPFDVLTGDTGYQLDDQVEGLYTRGSAVYHPPRVQASVECPKTPPASSLTLRSLLLAARLAYTHTGPKVLADQLDVAGLAGALLLPVARIPGAAENLAQVSAHLFPDDGRLLPGCAFPIGIPPDKLDSFFRSARETRGIRAIKLHPNLTGVDPLTESGRDLIEAMLAAAGSLDLPVVVHGGRTLALEPAACREYGTLAHLANVDWSVSSAPVIIAHGGLYSLTEEEAIAALDALERLFERHPNLMADTSNLEPPALRLVLEKVDRNRLVFGSDALYIPIWKSWVRFLQTLRLVSQHPDDDLIRIASLNPIRCLDYARRMTRQTSTSEKK